MLFQPFHPKADPLVIPFLFRRSRLISLTPKYYPGRSQHIRQRGLVKLQASWTIQALPEIFNLLTPKCFLLPDCFLSKVPGFLKVQRPGTKYSSPRAFSLYQNLVETLGVCSFGRSSALPRSCNLSSLSFSLKLSPIFTLGSSPSLALTSSPVRPSFLPWSGLLVLM